MRLVIIEINAFNSGHYYREISTLTKLICEDFEEIEVITPFGFKEKNEFEKNVRVRKIYAYRQKISFLFQFFFYLKVFSFLKKSSNIIHIWGYKSVFPIQFAKYFHKVKINCITIKDIKRERIGIFTYAPLGWLQLNISSFYLKRIAQKFVTHNNEIYTDVINIGILKDNVYVISTALLPTIINLSQLDAKKYLQIDLHINLLLFFGVIRDEKGIYEILEFAKRMKNDKKILIVGENREKNTIADFIGSNNLKEKILIFDEYIAETEVKYFFRAADVNIIYHKPNFKGDSGVFLQACSFGVPSVTHTFNSTAKIINEYDLGEVCDYLDFEGLERCIESVIDKKEHYIKNIKNYLIDNNAENMKNKYLMLYKDLIL